MKICTKCKIEKELCEFYKRKDSVSGYRGICKKCTKVNKEYNKKYKSEYYIKNEDEIKKKKAIHYKNNKDAIKKKSKEYRESDKGRIVKRNSTHKRRSIKNNGNVKTNDILKLIETTKKCYWCECNIKNKEVHIDHYIPLSKGGKHNIDNLVISCSTCNLRKNAKDPLKFANEIGKLC